MLEMGTAYLPVNSGWERYISEAEAVWSDLEAELRQCLMHAANDACQLMHGQRYKDDPWLWDLDWTPHPYKKKALKVKTKKNEEISEKELAEKLIEAAESQASKQPSHLAGYPKWYRELCPRDHQISADTPPGPSEITIRKRVAAKLLRLTWEGFPLHYEPDLGWGYLVPKLEHEMSVGELHILENVDQGEDEPFEDGPIYPTKAAVDMIRRRYGGDLELQEIHPDNAKLKTLLSTVDKDGIEPAEHQKLWQQISRLEKKIAQQKEKQRRGRATSCLHKGIGPFPAVEIPGMHFFKMPHKDGPEKNVGNPLSKDFLQHIEQGVLHSQMEEADRFLRLNIQCSYWKMNRERIKSQMVLGLDDSTLPKTVTENESYNDAEFYGAILPRVITAGTVTRRAVEATWLTASNAYEDRVGSELKAIVQSPPGYHFVGADVDSQELWIAAILGDAHFAGVHGCTAFGWMTLQGKKSEGTDLHSKTASLVGISRDQAKIFNYGRIYGAGRIFARRLLMQFNHRLTPEAAASKARTMYLATKGERIKKRHDGEYYEKDSVSDLGQWHGGSESYMFNKLESIAMEDKTCTPVLGCRISKTLEPRRVNFTEFMTSRVNWVVQSSAVDYLHLMLVCMRWLCDTYNIQARFSISIHDEVRYLVKSEDRYRAALALQITNLLTRSMFAHKLGMKDLPQSVAFFSAVDIDQCLRKEVDMDCRTPSNPSGLSRGYGLSPGEALDIYTVLEKTNSSLKEADQPISDVGDSNCVKAMYM